MDGPVFKMFFRSHFRRKRLVPNHLPGHNRFGFTLVELMVAILLFGIVITTIFASYNAVFTSAGRVSSGIDRYDMAGICLNRISFDLHSLHMALPPQYRKPESKDVLDPYRLVGELSDPDMSDFPRLRFASLAHIPFHGKDFGGIARIVYYVRKGTDGNYQMRRSDTINPSEPFEELNSDPVLCEHLKSLKITYYDSEGTSFENWNSESDEFGFASPVAVEILMEMEQDEGSVMFNTTVALPVQRESLE